MRLTLTRLKERGAGVAQLEGLLLTLLILSQHGCHRHQRHSHNHHCQHLPSKHQLRLYVLFRNSRRYRCLISINISNSVRIDTNATCELEWTENWNPLLFVQVCNWFIAVCSYLVTGLGAVFQMRILGNRQQKALPWRLGVIKLSSISLIATRKYVQLNTLP